MILTFKNKTINNYCCAHCENIEPSCSASFVNAEAIGPP